MKELFKNRSVIFYCILALAAFLVLRHHDMYISSDKEDYWEGIWVEAHGMFMDIIILGLFLAIYDFYRDRREVLQNLDKERQVKIERYLEEIDDYRCWEEPEAKQKILGIIKRLNKLNVKVFDLSFCYLKGSYFQSDSFEKMFFWEAKLMEVNFCRCNLIESNFSDADLTRAKIISSNLSNSIFYRANLTSVNIYETNLERVNFDFSIFKDATISISNLKNTSFIHSDFRGVNLYNVQLEGANFKYASIYEYQKEFLLKLGVDISTLKIFLNPIDFEEKIQYYLESAINNLTVINK